MLLAATIAKSTVTIVDDDNRSVDVSRTSLTIDEGRTEFYTIVLGRQPTGDVTITTEVIDARDSAIAVTPSITFAPQNWNIPVAVLVSAEADDNRANGSATITHTITGADYEANGVTAPSVEVAELDAAGRTVVTLVHVPDGTVIPDNSTLTVGETVEDGSTFTEGDAGTVPAAVRGC